MKPKLTLLVCLLLGAGLLAGCGGDDEEDPDSGSTDALSREEFDTRAEEICAGAKEEISSVTADLRQRMGEDSTKIPELFKELFTSVAPIVRDTMNELGTLTPPEDLEQTLDDFVAQANEAADQLEADPAKLAKQALGGENPFPELEQLGTELGLQDCVQLDGGAGDGG